MTDLSGNSLLYGQDSICHFDSKPINTYSFQYELYARMPKFNTIILLMAYQEQHRSKGKVSCNYFHHPPADACAFDSLNSTQLNSLTHYLLAVCRCHGLYAPGKLFNILTCNFLSIFHNTCTLIQFFFFTQRSSSTPIHNLYNLYFLHKRKNILSQLVSFAVYPLHTIARRSPCLQFTLHLCIPHCIDEGLRVGKGMKTTKDSESL